jgi:hypothetical protein
VSVPSLREDRLAFTVSQRPATEGGTDLRRHHGCSSRGPAPPATTLRAAGSESLTTESAILFPLRGCCRRLRRIASGEALAGPYRPEDGQGDEHREDHEVLQPGIVVRSSLYLVMRPGAKHGMRSRSKLRKAAIFQHQSRHGQNLSVVVSQPMSYSCLYLRLRTGRIPRSRRGARRSQPWTADALPDDVDLAPDRADGVVVPGRRHRPPCHNPGRL